MMIEKGTAAEAVYHGERGALHYIHLTGLFRINGLVPYFFGCGSNST